MLMLRMLLREWRGGELGILGAALILAVSVVTGIGLFAERLQLALQGESEVFLAGEAVLESSDPIAEAWLDEALGRGLSFSQTTEFPSMAYFGDTMQLASVKAVSTSYPLRGTLKICQAIYCSEHSQVRSGPANGEAWIGSNLALSLGLSIGQTLELGSISLKVTAIVVDEPDQTNKVFSLGPRLMMNDDDLLRAQLIMPGSRVSWRYQLDGPRQALDDYLSWLTPQLGPNQRIQNLQEGQPRVAQALDRAQRFLHLAGSLAIVLAGVAVALSARRYVMRHQDYVAIVRTLGATRGQIRRLYGGGLMVLSAICIVPGWLLGWSLQSMFFVLMADLISVQVPNASILPFISGALTAVFALLAFVWPSFYALQNTPPARVIRADQFQLSLHPLYSVGFALLGILALVWHYAGDLSLTLALCMGVLLLLIAASLVAWVLLRLLPQRHVYSQTAFGMALATMQRRPRLVVVQVAVFGACLMLVACLWVVRDELLAEWQAQLPENAPNQFLINVAEHEVPDITAFLRDASLQVDSFYPMVRGRLTHINGVDIADLKLEKAHRATRRDANLTWSDSLPLGNKLMAGEWWRVGETGLSLETRLAEDLHVGVGDSLRFKIADQTLEVAVTSLREVDWQQMHPNFFMVVSPGLLENYPASYITSFYLPTEQRALLVSLGKQFPSVSVLDLDAIITQLRATIDKVGRAIQLVFVLVLIAAALVLEASINSGMDERLKEAAIYRVFGAQQARLRQAVVWEFLLIGFLAGLVAVLGAELALWILQTQFLNMPSQMHGWLWLSVPILASAIIAIIGYFACRNLISLAPAKTLRILQ